MRWWLQYVLHSLWLGTKFFVGGIENRIITGTIQLLILQGRNKFPRVWDTLLRFDAKRKRRSL